MGPNRVRNDHVQPPCPDHPWTVRQVVQTFLLNRARDVERGLLAPRTLRDYRWILEHFCEAFGHWPVAQLKPAHVCEWIDAHSSWRSPSRVAGVVRALKVCFGWWARMNGEPHPLAGLSAPTTEPRRPIKPEDFARILDACSCCYVKSALLFLWYTGCRPSELAAMRIDHLDEIAGVWVITLSRHKTYRRTKRLRAIVLGPKAKAVVDRVLSLPPRPRPTIFCTPTGRPWTTESLSRRFSRYRDLAGVTREVTLYSVRHAAALRAYRAGIDTKALADYLGTSSQMLDRFYLSQSMQLIIRMSDVANVLESE